MKFYIAQAKDSRGSTEWVVRSGFNNADIAICACPGRAEAELIKQALENMYAIRNKSVDVIDTLPTWFR